MSWRSLLLLALVAVLGSGCQPLPPQQGVVLWTGVTDQERAVLVSLGQRFEHDTGVPVKVQAVPFDDLRVKYQIAAPAGLGPDIVTGPNDWVGTLATAHLIQPLSEADFGDKRAFMPTAVEAVSFAGACYGYPYSLETLALIYNLKLIPKPPDTFPALLAVARELKHDDQYGLLFWVDKFYYAWPFFSGYGATVFSPAGGIPTVALDSPAAVQAGHLIVDMHELMFPGVDETFARQLFGQGKVGCILDGPWVLGDVSGHFPLQVQPLPPLGPGLVPKPFVSVQSFMLNPRSTHHDEAIRFLHYVETRDNLLQLTDASGRVPARRDSLAARQDKPALVAFARQAEQGVPMPNVPALNAVWPPFDDALKLILSGANVEQTLHQAVEQTNLDIRQMME
ncbi:MAG TPA: maltose ABC transporter substrate-binding protein [Candidatus Xenobia bacterium]